MTDFTFQSRADHQVAALIVTYFPDAGFTQRLERLLEQVSRVVIVDNGSDDASLDTLRPYLNNDGVTLHRNGANLGIASALNKGMGLLVDEAYTWVLTLDQDSTVSENFVHALQASLAADLCPDRVAMVGANRLDRGSLGVAHRWLRPRRGIPFFERVTCDRLGAHGTTAVITSGTLTSVAAYRRLGSFRDDFFIDLVDIEYCLRARRAGYRILVSPEAELIHQVGAKQRVTLLGVALSPTHHVPLRRYYLFRNSVSVLRSYGAVYPHWLIYHLVALAEVIAGVLLVEPRKLAKLRACAVGLLDGLRGRAGPAHAGF